MTLNVQAQTLAFPSATGAGAYTTGGRGKTVFIVTNLNNSGSGSFRQAILDAENNDGGIITFAVSGTIELTSNVQITGNNITIAGQTAPAGGITFTGYKIDFYDADNLIIRYLKFRPDYQSGGSVEDASRFVNCEDVILDHCSFSWGADEVVSATHSTNNITWQRNLMAEGKTGSLFGDSNDPSLSQNMSFHNNLYYNITHRFPNVTSDGRVDVINNVVFNWKFRLSVMAGDVELNHMNNYYAKGCLGNVDDLVNKYYYNGDVPEIHTSGNLIMPNTLTDPNTDNWMMWEWRVDVNTGPYAGALRDEPLTTDFQASNAFDLLGNPLQILSASEAFTDVTQNVGANAYLDENGNKIDNVDGLDTMYLNNVIAENCVDYESYSAYQDYETNQHYINFHNSVSSTPLSTGYQDTNNDGIPDAWKISRGFGINEDLTAHVWASGYVGIEEFLNEIDGESTPENVFAGNDVTICEGESVTLTATNAQNYDWSTGDSTPSITVNPLSTTTYTVVGTHADGSTSTDVVIVVVNALPNANAGNDVAICEGETITLTASGGDTYVWNTGEITQSITVTPSDTITYTVIAYQNNCEATDDVVVTVNSLPAVDAGNDVTIIEGESVTLTANGGDTYEWNTGETTQSITVNPNSTTTYTVTAYQNNCEATDEVVVTVNGAVTANAGEDVTICEDESTTLTASGGDTYEWNTGETTQSITVNPNDTTTYTVTVSINNDTDTDDVIVFVNALPNANAGNDVEICEGETITLTASGGDTYVWNTGETTQSITVSPNSTTTYTVTVYQNNCESTDDVVVTVNSLPAVDAGNDVTIIEGESVTLTANGGDTYEWNTGETTQSITVNPNSTTTYTVTAYQNNCEATDDVVVTVNGSVTANAGEDVTICEGESTTLTASGGDTYLWNTGETTQSIIVSPNDTTIYSVTVFLGDASDVDDVNVFINVLPNVNAGSDIAICEGESITLTANGGDSYLWNTGETTQNITVNPNTTTTYVVTAYQNNCEATDEVVITVNSLPAVDAGNDVTIIEGESVTLTANGGDVYEWNTGETTQSITVSPNSTATYTVTAYQNNCEATDEVVVTVNEAVNASAGDDVNICQGSEVTLTASGGDSYLWNTGETTQSITVNPSGTSNYTVIVSNEYSQDTDDVTVFVNPNPEVEVSDDVTILTGNYVTLSATGANNYEWSNGATQPNIAVNPNITTTYFVTGYVNDCSDVKDVTVSVLEYVEADAGEDVWVCPGEQVTLIANGGDTYVWNTGETTQSITVNPEEDTTYTVLVSNELDSQADEVRVYMENCEVENPPIEEQQFEYLVYLEATNPKVLNIKLGGLQGKSRVLIHDILGNVVYQEFFDDNNSLPIVKQIPLDYYSTGVYLVTLQANNKKITKRLLFR